MATPNPTPLPRSHPKAVTSEPTYWQKHGTTAAWVALVFSFVTVCIGAATLVTTWYFHYSAGSAVSSDEHINLLIGKQLSPAVAGINLNIDTKLRPLSDKLDDLSDRVSDAQGQLKRMRGGIERQNKRQDQQASLAKLMDPNRILGTIRAELQVAKFHDQPVSSTTLVDYRNVLQEVPASTVNYWNTVAEVINYQSLINQLSGAAPDPAKVAHFCGGMTEGSGGHNIMQGGTIANCILDLDTTENILQNVLVKDSVVRYHGGALKIKNVTFENCTFIIDIKDATKQPKHPALLLALLDSNQRIVRLAP